VSLYNLIAVLFTLVALFSYFNHVYLRLPMVIGVMAIALVLSLLLLLLDLLGLHVAQPAAEILAGLDFNTTLMQGVLCYLLFAGALFVDLDDLARQKWLVAGLATFGTLLCTVLVGLLSYGLAHLLGLELPLIYCFLFGALISPTDPVAVIAILRDAGVKTSIRTKITGESLFNDGIGVVVFLVLLGFASGEQVLSAGGVVLLLLQEVLGGLLLGLMLGGIGYLLLRRVDVHTVAILVTLALVSGGYALCFVLHVSGPIAMVVAGLMVGNHGRMLALGRHSREHLEHFWELADEILNALLFMIIGLEVLLIHFTGTYLVAGAAAIVVVLLARFVSVALPVTLLRLQRSFSPGIVRILTWGGIRGGISVALALTLPPGPEQEILLALTYCVVIFSILVQGTSIGKLTSRWAGPATAAD